MIVTLDHGYYIEIKRREYILRQKYLGVSKTGEGKMYERVHGHFSNLHDAIERYVTLNQIDKCESEVIRFEELLDAIDKANGEAVKTIEKRTKDTLVTKQLLSWISKEKEKCDNTENQERCKALEDVIAFLNSKTK